MGNICELEKKVLHIVMSWISKHRHRYRKPLGNRIEWSFRIASDR